MKRIFRYSFFIVLQVTLILSSCKRENSCENCMEANKPPIAHAGNDTTIIFPTDSVLLNGSKSIDPDNNIKQYNWTKISGPSFFSIDSSGIVKAKVVNLVEGTYLFELKVTDAGGLFSKDTVQVNVVVTNYPPIANAGTDIAANYDLQTCSMNPAFITLNGSTSADPDGTIVSYQWRGAGMLSTPNSAIIQVSMLTPGLHPFILQVTDNKGATREDTVIINVVNLLNRPLINAQLVSIGTLTQQRAEIAVAAAGNKILFAGGYVSNASYLDGASRVDIYDRATKIWSTAELSQRRSGIATAVLGNKIFFAGGIIDFDSASSRVDIYDVVANTWNTAKLSIDRTEMAAGVAGNKVVFAGGTYSTTIPYTDRVDIYDAGTDTWSVASLSEKNRAGMSATTIGNKIYFAGGTANSHSYHFGTTSKIDIYDAVSDSWSQSSMNAAKAYHAAIAINNKNFWAGGGDGLVVSNQVEIRDENAQSVGFECLSGPNGSFTAVLKNNKIVFFTGSTRISGVNSSNKFDIYDIASSTWSIGVLPFNMERAAIISIDNTIYVAGGLVNGVLSNQVWKLEF